MDYNRLKYSMYNVLFLTFLLQKFIIFDMI